MRFRLSRICTRSTPSRNHSSPSHFTFRAHDLLKPDGRLLLLRVCSKMECTYTLQICRYGMYLGGSNAPGPASMRQKKNQEHSVSCSLVRSRGLGLRLGTRISDRHNKITVKDSCLWLCIFWIWLIRIEIPNSSPAHRRRAEYFQRRSPS